VLETPKALLRSDGPKVDELILDIISLEFHETLMAPSGHQAEKHWRMLSRPLRGTISYLWQGSIPMAMDGQYGTIGATGETFHEHLTRLSEDAKAVVAVGSCATFGGIPAASPNPTGARGVMDVINGKPIVN